MERMTLHRTYLAKAGLIVWKRIGLDRCTFVEDGPSFPLDPRHQAGRQPEMAFVMQRGGRRGTSMTFAASFMLCLIIVVVIVVLPLVPFWFPVLTPFAIDVLPVALALVRSVNGEPGSFSGARIMRSPSLLHLAR